MCFTIIHGNPLTDVEIKIIGNLIAQSKKRIGVNENTYHLQREDDTDLYMFSVTRARNIGRKVLLRRTKYIHIK